MTNTHKLQTQEFIFYSDPAHGWLRVKLEDARRVPAISSYSYMDSTYAYLEEDCDLARFCEFYGLELTEENTKESNSNSMSHVRNKVRFCY